MTSGCRQKSPGSLTLAPGPSPRIEPGRVYLKNGNETTPNDIVFTCARPRGPLNFRRSKIRSRARAVRGWIALGVCSRFAFRLRVEIRGIGGDVARSWLENMPALLSSPGGWFNRRLPIASTLLGTPAVSLKSRRPITRLYSSLSPVSRHREFAGGTRLTSRCNDRAYARR